MSLGIPLVATPSQTITVNLDNQPTRLHVYQLSTGLFMDVYLSDQLVIGGVVCQNLNRIVRNRYLGYSGDFAWTDSVGNSDPSYVGIGSRFVLVYFTADEIAAMGLGG